MPVSHFYVLWAIEMTLVTMSSFLIYRRSEPSFVHSINHVFRLSAQEQMVGIDAGRIVATMADKKAIWYRATKYLV